MPRFFVRAVSCTLPPPAHLMGGTKTTMPCAPPRPAARAEGLDGEYEYAW